MRMLIVETTSQVVVHVVIRLFVLGTVHLTDNVSMETMHVARSVEHQHTLVVHTMSSDAYSP